MTTAIFPGKFDPVSMGHLDIISRSAQLFDRIIVAVFDSPSPKTLFSVAERQEMIRDAARDLSNIEVDTFRGLVVDYARSKGAHVLVRGLRLNTDFEYEFEMALMNRKLGPDIEVVCLITSLEYQYVRSSRLKEVAAMGGNISGLAPPNVIKALTERRRAHP
jgi:pantetheine-phosphate adenylyltransferase